MSAFKKASWKWSFSWLLSERDLNNYENYDLLCSNYSHLLVLTRTACPKHTVCISHTVLIRLWLNDWMVRSTVFIDIWCEHVCRLRPFWCPVWTQSQVEAGWASLWRLLLFGGSDGHWQFAPFLSPLHLRWRCSPISPGGSCSLREGALRHPMFKPSCSSTSCLLSSLPW